MFNRFPFSWNLLTQKDSLQIKIELGFPSLTRKSILLMASLSQLMLSPFVRAVYYRKYQRRQWHPLQSSCLENPMDGGAWWAAVHGVMKSQIRLSNFTFPFHFHALEKETHSSVLAWRIPGMGEPGGLPSMGSHRVGHDWSGLAAAAAVHLTLFSPFCLHIHSLKQLW